MNRIVALLGTLAIAATTQSAIAADLPARPRAAPVPVVAVAPINWSGFYIGGHGGWVKSDTDWTFFNGIVSETFSQSDSSWIAGGQAGFMFQFAYGWVVGMEVSYSRTDLSSDSTAQLVADRSRKSEIHDLILATARIGYAADRWLTYVKGGYANADVDFQTRVTSTSLVSSTSSHRDSGWTVGAGLEYAFTQYISFGLEYNFVHLFIDDRTQAVTPGFAVPQTVTDASADLHMVWARLNFRFNPSGPVVARY
jgi:outer membrane immunogenic protein